MRARTKVVQDWLDESFNDDERMDREMVLGVAAMASIFLREAYPEYDWTDEAADALTVEIASKNYLYQIPLFDV